MALHKVPLCNFKYASDVYSGCTFRYDTTGKIFKAEKPKLLHKSVKEIKKNEGNKLLRSICNESAIKNNNKFLRRNDYNIIKSISKYLKTENRCINLNSGISLSLEKFRNVILNIGRSIELENTDDIIINLEHIKNLGYAYSFIEFGQGKNKNLQEFKDKQINRNDFLVYFDRENLLLDLVTNDTYMDKLIEKPMDKDKSIIYAVYNRIRFIDKSSERYFYRLYFIQAFLYKDKFYERYDVSNISVDNCRIIYRIGLKNIDYRNYIFNLKRNTLRPMSKTYRLMRLKRATIKRIMRDLQAKLLRKDNRKNLFVIADTYGLDRLAVNYIFKDSSKFFRRYTGKNIYLDYNIQLEREAITEVNKMRDEYLKDISFINIYRQVEKALLDVTILNIFRNESYSLSGFSTVLYKSNHNKFIDIIKRWWWLNFTTPEDSLIIPNKDFSYNGELLNNPEYEYLRFTNHPIEWGNNWGIDWNIPTYAVSIEIMLDLVNILVMVWHSNVQGWLCCSGKESMQFIMELFYDCYTLETSNPNADYYRAYRWIRWEAEKVYFSNLDNGLQAVGVLISNLIDYLKQHHFNLFPLWRNPKAMDVERNFNRVAKNGDLMKALDKIKGKRYYYTETQNIKKKNILGDDENGGNS